MKVENLLQKLEGKSWVNNTAIREEILTGLKDNGNTVIDAITKMAIDKSPETRMKACKLLEHIGAIDAFFILENERGEDILIRALDDEFNGIRLQAIHALILIEETKKTGKSIPKLIDILKNDKNPDMRAELAMLLGFVRWNPKVTEALIQSLEDEQPIINESMFGTSVGMPVSQYAIEGLAKSRVPSCLEALTPKILHGGSNVEHTVELFERFGPAAVEYLIKGFEDEEWQVRERVAAALGQIGDIRAVTLLIRAISDNHHKVRRAAVEALGKMKSEEAVEQLYHALSDQDNEVKSKAFRSLVNIGQPALPFLIQALNSTDNGIRRSAASALGDINDIRALEALTLAVKDKSWLVRSEVREAIKKFKKKQR